MLQHAQVVSRCSDLSDEKPAQQQQQLSTCDFSIWQSPGGSLPLRDKQMPMGNNATQQHIVVNERPEDYWACDILKHSIGPDEHNLC